MVSISGVNRYLLTIFQEGSCFETASPLHECFGSTKAPLIQLSNYLEHLQYSMKLDASHWGLAMTYLQRLLTASGLERLPLTSVHRFALTSVVVAYKFLEEVSMSNSSISSFAGVTAPELKQMERVLVEVLEWNLAPDQDADWTEVFSEELSTAGSSENQSECEDAELGVVSELDCFSELAVFFT